jgi:hypothetical protein
MTDIQPSKPADPGPARLPTPPTALQRLRRVEAVLDLAGTEMAAVAGPWTVPGPPDRPAFVAVLQQIVAESQTVHDIAARLLATIPATPPSPGGA